VFLCLHFTSQFLFIYAGKNKLLDCLFSPFPLASSLSALQEEPAVLAEYNNHKKYKTG
jgi:hypothetical protein